MDHHPLSTTLVVSVETAATRSARSAVRDLCSTAEVGHATVETAVLLLTELVTNAIEHGGGTAVVDAEVDDGLLRVAVVDDDPTIPTVNVGAVDDERGRGLLLVEALSTRWGAALRERGKSVWFELDLAPSS
jgi:anti-sigma regulatory factor (Ser/Thr protein kinase)